MIYSLIISLVLAYLLGSVNSAIIVSRLFGVGDIRKSGSGNAGATNTLRVVGKKAAVFVVLGDALKGIISVLCAGFVNDVIFKLDTSFSIYAAAVSVVLGHVFPLYFGFKGGKGIMTSIAVVFMLDFRIGLLLVALFAIILLLFNYVSLASCVCAFVYPFLVLFMQKGNIAMLISACIMAIIAIVKHRSNIIRLLNGNESKLFKSRK